jgi:LPXTG-motif cell wall-anchored protein
VTDNNSISIKSGDSNIAESASLGTELENGIAIVTDSSSSAIAHNYEIYIEDAPLYDLPNAGRSGIYWLISSGVALMMGGSLLMFIRRRRMFRI